MGLSPSIIQQARVSCVGKVKDGDARGCPAAGFRPIMVQRRAWSTMWLRAPCINEWKESIFPTGMAGAAKGTSGPEVLAAVADALLAEFKFGVSLDFSHAFDCISAKFLGAILTKALPSHCLGWARDLVYQWEHLSRWFHFGGHCHERCLVGDCGVPQGDPASPFALLLLLLAGKVMVAQQVPGIIWQCIYMDDRMAVTQDREDAIRAAQAWQMFAQKIHMKENVSKTQYIDLTLASAEGDISFKQSCEHLGTCIGNPGTAEFRSGKNLKRTEKALEIASRISLLPCGTQLKLDDCKVFGLSRMAYGWVRRFPLDKWCKALDRQILHTLGQFNYGIFELKQILIQAHMAQANVTFRLISLLAMRNRVLEKIGHGGIQCALDQTVHERLGSLGWFLHLGKWKHLLFPSGFSLDGICELEMWKKVHHFLRNGWRAHHWNRLQDSHRHRHELAGSNIPAFTEMRFELVKRFSRVDGMALKLSIGAVQSPYVRSLGDSGRDSLCPFCGALNVFWEHLWICGMQQNPPEDILLQRFGWPLCNETFGLSLQFLEVVKKFGDSYNRQDSVTGNAGHPL